MARVTTSIERLFASPVILFPQQRATTRLVLLDAGRGLAAVAVLFWHYQHFFYVPGGHRPAGDFAAQLPLHHWFGLLYDHGHNAVPIFWMISGFVFARVYYGKSTSNGDFVLHRVARLYPLHLLTLCIVALLQLAAIARFGTTLLYPYNDVRHFGLQLLFASHWGAERGFSFNAPIWSVSVEVLIYTIFWATRRWLPRFGIAGPLSAAGVSLMLVQVFPGNAIALCGLYFFGGVALCMVSIALERSRLLPIAVLAMMGAGLYGFARGAGPSGEVLGIAGTFGGTILLLGALEPSLAQRLRDPCRVIGDNTYGMYLWHVPLQLTLFLLLAGPAGLGAVASKPWFLLLYLGAVVIIARLGYRMFERRMDAKLRSRGRIWIAHGRGVTSAALASMRPRFPTNART